MIRGVDDVGHGTDLVITAVPRAETFGRHNVVGLDNARQHVSSGFSRGRHKPAGVRESRLRAGLQLLLIPG